MVKTKTEIPQGRVVMIHGEKFEDVKDITPPNAESPYWTIKMDNGSFIWATGDVSVRHTPTTTSEIEEFHPGH